MRWRKISIVAAIVLVVVVGVSVFCHYQRRAATEAYIAKLKAQGEPLELRQVLPPPVLAEQNSAPLFLQATALFATNWNVLDSNPPSAMKMVAPGKAMVGWKQPVIRDGNASNSWPEVEVALAEAESGLALLRQIPERPVFDFRIQYDMGFDKIPLRRLAISKSAVLKLSAAALCDARHGRPAEAAKNIHAMLALVEGMAHDRVVISELVRIALAQIAFGDNWEVLQAPGMTDEQLAGLQQAWAGLEFIRAGERALELERAVDRISLAEWRSSNAALRRFSEAWEDLGLHGVDKNGNEIPRFVKKTLWDKLKLNAKIYLWRYWWSYPDELLTLQGYQRILENVRAVECNHALLPAQQELESKQGKASSFWFTPPDQADFHAVLSSGIPALVRVFNKVLKVEAARQLTVTAIALKRFQLKHGNLPEKLSDLSPEFLAAVPLDPVDGQPLRYQRNADGTFLLYSIGEDGVDDIGDARPPGNSKSRQWQNGRDWVWPQPATPKEIEDFFVHPLQ